MTDGRDKYGSPFGKLISAYSLARRTGFLDTAPGRFLFTTAYFAYKRLLEDPYAGLARRRPELFRNGHILDVGANIGYTASVFARAISPGFHVHAFEPEEFNFRLLERSARGAGGRIIPVNSAVGDADGTITLRINPEHHGDHQVARGAAPDPKLDRAVPITKLDTYAEKSGIADKIAFIKIDVQGYETAVCRGMRGILSASEAVTVSLEYMPEAFSAFGADGEALLDELSSAGFKTGLLDTHGKSAVVDREGIRAAVARDRYLNLLFTR